MEVVRYDQLPEMFEAEKTLESGVKADFKVLGLSNGMALPIIEMERLANCTAETGAQGRPVCVQWSVNSPQTSQE